MRRLKKFVLLVLLFCAMQLAPALSLAEGWNNVEELPFGRHQMVSGVIGGKIYTVTGSAPIADATNVLQVFDPSTGETQMLAPMPEVASHAGAAVLDGKIYVAGGFVANPHLGAQNSLYAYDVASDTWQRFHDMPFARGSSVVVALNGKIHVITGDDVNGLIGDHAVYDPQSDSWSSAAPLPLARDHAGGFAMAGEIHVFGGRPACLQNTSRHDIYDPKTDSWREGPPMLTPRSGGAAFAVGDLLLYAGGECKTGAQFETNAEVEAFDVSENRWVKLPDMPRGSHGAAGGDVSGTAYILGGRTNGCGAPGGAEQLLSDILAYKLLRDAI